MSFAQPAVLWGLIGPALGSATLIVLAVLRRRRRWTRWPGISRVVAIGAAVHPVGVAHGTRRPWLLLLSLTLALVALAGPRWGVIEEPVYQKSREVMIALDLSRSMLVQDVLPSRLERSRLLVRSLLDGLRGERIGLIVFAGTAFVQVPMSSDYQILEEFLPELKPGYMPQGGSDYEGMLRAAITGFSAAADTDRYLIVLSDGEAQDARWREQMDEVKAKAIQVIALGVGTTAGGFIPDPETGAYVKDPRGAVVLSKLEPATLQALAQETQGVYRDASNWVDLAALLQETVERGREGRFTEKRAARAIERFQWFLAPALLLALLGIWREIPIIPRARLVRRASPAAAAAPRASQTTAVVTTLALAALLIPVAPSIEAAVQDQTPAAAVDKLRSTVSRLASSDTVAAAGWKAMAEQTLAYSQETLQGKQPVEPGLIRDALAAVDAGERMDPRAADWAKLREDLRRLLEPPPPPEQKPEDQKQNQQDKKQEQQQQDKQQESEQSDSSQNEQKQDSSDQQQQQQSKQEQQQQSAEQDQKQDSRPEQQKTRKFGGRQDKQKQQSSNPEMASALTRLEQVHERDQPAVLHQRLEQESNTERRAAAPATNPHDW